VRATLAGLLCLLLVACTGGGGGEPDKPARPAAPSLKLTVVSMPLNCRPVPGVPDGCQVGGSGLADGLGKVRVYSGVRLGLPRPGGCREATTTGSLSGAAWSVRFAGGGEWCGQRARFTYRLGGPSGSQGRLEYVHEPPAPATATFIGALPAPPAAEAARDPARRVDSQGCGRRPPVRPGRSGDLEVAADPALSAGAERRGYRVHVPTGYRHGRPFWASSGRVELGIDELRFTTDLLDDLQGRLCVDPARVAAAGFSAGGGVTARVACELAGRVAAVATVAAALFTDHRARGVPALAPHRRAVHARHGRRGAPVRRPGRQRRLAPAAAGPARLAGRVGRP
jgi:hypothetical protein